MNLFKRLFAPRPKPLNEQVRTAAGIDSTQTGYLKTQPMQLGPQPGYANTEPQPLAWDQSPPA